MDHRRQLSGCLQSDPGGSALGPLRKETGEWLERVAALSPTGVGHADVLAALEKAKDELEGIG